VAQLNSKLLLKSLTEHVRTGVPESIATFRLFKSEELDLAAAFKRAGGIPKHPSVTLLFSSCFWVCKSIVESSDSALGVANLAYYDFFCKLLRDHLGYIEGRSLERLSFLDCSVGKSNSDFLSGKFAVVFILYLEQ
jgi:hypothetical protein